MKRVLFLLFFALIILSTYSQAYKNQALKAEERAHLLLSEMTLEEKVGQMRCPLGWEMYQKTGNDVSYSENFIKLIDSQYIGMFWAVFRADPWTKKTLENGLNPKQAAEASNTLQRYVIEKTRLGIPLFIAEEAAHGHMAIGTTVFPVGIGQASTWNPDLLEKMAQAIAKEIRLQGAHISYGPVIDLSRDPRWSRIEESYGEDVTLTSKLAAAIVTGTGAGKLQEPYATIATLKHFVAYGISEGGHNGNTTSVGFRELYENFLLPFKTAIDAGALSVMTAYNAIDGIPCTANEFLLQTILRDQWNFQGFVVSDLGSIEGMHTSHFTAKSIVDAALQSVNVGLDVDLGGNSFKNLIEIVESGVLKEIVIDNAVYPILRLKFEMGLFDNPYVDPLLAEKEVRSPEHLALAREVARESIVLLKNEDVLPLRKNKKIAVIGPNAANVYNQLGDYTAPQADSDVVTVLDGIRTKIGIENVLYEKGCSIRDTLQTTIDEAVQAALKSDIAVVVVGGSSARDFKTSYIETGAAVADKTTVSDMDSGEGFDRASLCLLGKQLDLLKAVKATGKPIVVIYIQGRPLEMNWAAKNADALLTAWYPGQEGGNAIADVLFGDYNPAGRLPISVPRHVGQIPVYYNKKNPRGHDYVEMSALPLYAFGYGLSFTSFEYKNLKINQKQSDCFEVTLEVKNTGNYDGDEVVQLYLKDHYASVTQPIKQLKYFGRMHIKKGTTETVRFVLQKEDFSIVDKNLNRVVEPGDFTVMIGNASDNIRLEKVIRVE